jgi:hypothetical protein
MVLFDGMGGLLVLALWIFCFVDVLLTPDGACRNLPKLAWVFIVLLFSIIGSIAWLVAGRPWNRGALQVPARQGGGRTGRPARTGQSVRTAPTNPDDDEEFLASLSKRAEEQRRARERQEREGREGDAS